MGTVTKYSGADWIESACKIECSPLGKKVADLLGQVFRGIYHVQCDACRVDWTATHEIRFRYYGGRGLSTYDAGELTYLVVLCHDAGIRLSIQPYMRALMLSFTQRSTREHGNSWERHPTLEDHAGAIRNEMALPDLYLKAPVHLGANGEGWHPGDPDYHEDGEDPLCSVCNPTERRG